MSATCEFFSVTSQGCRLFTIDAETTDLKRGSNIIGGPRVCPTGYSYDHVLYLHSEKKLSPLLADYVGYQMRISAEGEKKAGTD